MDLGLKDEVALVTVPSPWTVGKARVSEIERWQFFQPRNYLINVSCGSLIASGRTLAILKRCEFLSTG